MRERVEHEAGDGRPQPTTVVLVDSQALVRSTIRRALRVAGLDVVGEADCPVDAVREAVAVRPDVVLADFVFPDGRADIDAIEKISVLAPASRILVLTESKTRDGLLDAILAGACGYVLKEAGMQPIVDATRAAARGQCTISPEVAGTLLEHIRERDCAAGARSGMSGAAISAALTDRELEIFKRLATGESNRQIGSAFSLSENTVKNHVASILAKLHLDNRIQAAAHAVRTGLSCVAPAALLGTALGATDGATEVLSLLLGG